jgi:hypothetical protein
LKPAGAGRTVISGEVVKTRKELPMSILADVLIALVFLVPVALFMALDLLAKPSPRDLPDPT